MAQKESQTGRADQSSPFSLMPAEFVTMGKQRVEDLVKAQTEIFAKLQRTNRHWFERMQSEADLTSNLASQLTAARSLSDAMAACQGWTTRHFELMVEDTKHLLDDTQELIQTGARLMVGSRRQ
jgi:hypothetical protein